MECCGVDGPTDWPKEKRPLTCCHSTRDGIDPPTQKHCTDAIPNDQILYSYGCFDELQMKADSASKVLIGVGIGIAFIEVCVDKIVVIYLNWRLILFSRLLVLSWLVG